MNICKRGWAAWISLVLLSHPCWCGACGSADGETGADAGLDASPDAVRPRLDAGPDAGRDARADASAAAWVTVEGLEHCSFRVATREDAVEPLRFGPCFDGRTGCQEVVVDWGDWRDEVFFVATGRGTWDTRRGSFLAVRVRGDLREMFVVSNDGRPLAAYRMLDSDPVCRHSFGAITREHFIASVFPSGFAAGPVSLVTIPLDFAGGPLVRHLSEADLGGPNRATQRIATSSRLTVAEMFPGQARLGVMTRDSFFLVEPPFPAYILHPVVHDDRAFALVLWSGESGFWSIGSDGVPERYLSSTDYDVPYFDVGLEHAAWMEGHTRIGVTSYERVVVKASEYSADPAGLRPREIGEFGPTFALGDAIRVDAGWVVYIDPTNGTAATLIAVNLTDGRRVQATVPEGYWFDGAPRYITPTEMGVAIKHSMSRDYRTLFRLEFAALPAAP